MGTSGPSTGLCVGSSGFRVTPGLVGNLILKAVVPGASVLLVAFSSAGIYPGGNKAVTSMGSAFGRVPSALDKFFSSFCGLYPGGNRELTSTGRALARSASSPVELLSGFDGLYPGGNNELI